MGAKKGHTFPLDKLGKIFKQAASINSVNLFFEEDLEQSEA